MSQKLPVGRRPTCGHLADTSPFANEGSVGCDWNARSKKKLRRDMDERFDRLCQFLGGYLHEDWPVLYGTPDGAVEKAIDEHPFELLQQVRRELQLLLSEITDDDELREILNVALGVNVHFKQPREARAFAEGVTNNLLRSIKKHFGESRARQV